jgi:spore maturation protein CgeB
MRIVLVGKAGSINHWLEDAAAAFRAEGHQVRLGIVRRSWLSAGVENALAEPLAAAMAARVARLSAELILVIGAYHAPTDFLERLRALAGRPAMAGWVGDIFNETARRAAELYDLVAYTDTGLLARHGELGFTAKAIFLPHAASGSQAPSQTRRAQCMVLVANATPGRRAVVRSIASPIAVRGPGWSRTIAGDHDVRPGRVAYRAVAGLYARHLAALNIRNEFNVLRGLNQRSFDPYLSATPVVTDDQTDLERCFDPGSETLVWRNPGELNEIYDRLRRDPGEARRVGEAGLRRVLAEHTFAHRLAAITAAL